MVKRPKVFYIPDDVYEHMIDSGINASLWVTKRYREEFLAMESKEKEVKKLERELKIKKKELNLLKKYDKQQRKLRKAEMNKPLTEKEIEFFKAFRTDRLGDPESIHNQIAAYRNDFNVAITKLQFLQKIEEYHKVMEECYHSFGIFDASRRLLKCRKCGFMKKL